MQIGDLVQLKHKPEEGTAHIKLEYGAGTEGGVRLDRKLDGFHSWNVSDLDVAAAGNESIACPECGFGWNDFTYDKHYTHCSKYEARS